MVWVLGGHDRVRWRSGLEKYYGFHTEGLNLGLDANF